MPLKPQDSLNKAYRRQKVNRKEIETFKSNLSHLLKELNESESEEHLKNDVTAFFNETWYKNEYLINTKGRTDLAIYNEKTAKSSVGVLLEVKKPGNKGEMISKGNLNAKALQELLLYYLREKHEHDNNDIKHLVVTNIYEWFIFDATAFYDHFYKSKKLKKAFEDWNANALESTNTDYFYKEIASTYIAEVADQLEYTWFDLRTYEKELSKEADSKKLISLYKLLSPVHLLKKPFANDSNSLNKQFYHELLHIIGLEEVKDKGKKVIQRKDKGKRIDGSLLENAMMTMDERDRLTGLNRPSHFGNTVEEQLYAVALELCITWINRILFLKLMESQLVSYHKGDASYRFLDFKTIPNFDALESLFFGVLARKPEDRSERYREKYAKVPYLNSSLFEPTGLEGGVFSVTQLNNNLDHSLYSKTVLKDANGKPLSGKMDTLEYLFRFLEAYDFSSEGNEEIQEENKSLINASVLGLIFEKINGYKDGSFYTPGFITMYMCRETIRRAVVQKFREAGYKLAEDADVEKNFAQLYDQIEDRDEANRIINRLKICDPAVGSGHFLVSALNEIISIKHDLKILQDRQGRRLKEYTIEVINDELVITDDDGDLFEYHVTNKESQRLQEALFHEKQTLIENCLFGVDINANSVKICRLRLWIELLKNAYYVTASAAKQSYGSEAQLQTLPNIDINIKTGNSLISRFDLDVDISDALKKSKWDIETYRSAVHSYKNATSKEDKREFERLINSIKGDFETEINKKDKRLMRLNKLKGELFNLTNQQSMFAMGAREKKKWEKEVATKTKALDKLEVELEEIKNNRIYEDAFEWRFEFPEVLDDAGNFKGFDVVIGNPPYIRQEELSDIKPYLSDHFNTFTGTADLYVYFVEQGMKLLREAGGFTFIIPNKWMRAGYGQKLRGFVKSFKIQELLDFGDLPVFEEATTYPLIIELAKSEPVEQFRAVNLDTLDYPLGMQSYVSDQSIQVLSGELADSGWTLTDSKVQKLLAKIRSKGKPLGEYVNGKIYRGVLTGLNEAFVIDHETRNRLIAEDPQSEEIIKPFLAGRDIKRYQQPTIKSYLILFKSGDSKIWFGKDVSEEEAFKKMSERYPSVMEHLSNYEKKATARYDKGNFWWELRACDYYDEFEKEKIAWPETSLDNQFMFVKEGAFLNKTAFIMPTGDRILLALLNSSIARFYFDSIVSKMRGGYFSMSKAYVETFPIVERVISDYQREIENLVHLALVPSSERNHVTEPQFKIDQLVYELYGLTEEEIGIIEQSVNGK